MMTQLSKAGQDIEIPENQRLKLMQMQHIQKDFWNFRRRNKLTDLQVRNKGLNGPSMSVDDTQRSKPQRIVLFEQ